MTGDGVRIRVGEISDAPTVLTLFDRAVEWLVVQGRLGQWGSEPWSAQGRRVRQMHDYAADGGLRIAEIDGVVAGAAHVGDAPSHAPPAPVPELYLEALVTDREHAGRGIGRALLRYACAEAIAQGATQLRLDCWAGGDQALVRYYERAGFTPTERFTVPGPLGDWEGQILVQHLNAPNNPT
jgi:GNAT superfamily N-acetyltransferase